MNVKMMSVCLACAGALLAGCGNSREKNAAAETEKTEIEIGRASCRERV